MANDKTCDGCGKLSDVKSYVKSTIHNHPAYNGPPAIAIIGFAGHDNHDLELCDSCVKKLLTSTINGGNYE